MVAQAAGHRDRDDFNPRLGPNPETMPRFQGMVGSILPSIDRQIRQMREVQQPLVITPDQVACRFQGGSMYFYIDGFYARGEDPRNRKMSDVYFIIYKPSGRPGQIACNCCVQLESELTPNVAQQS